MKMQLIGRTTLAMSVVIGLGGATPAVAQPTITTVSGTYGHKQSVTITGSNFGSKPTAAPLIWDDSSGTSITEKWSGGWPDHSANTNFNIAYRTPIRGVSPPHQRVGRYAAGAHAEENGYWGGWNVLFYKVVPSFSKPMQVYVSWYQRADPNWVFGLGSPADENYKTFDWSADATPFGSESYYTTYNPTPTSLSATPSWAVSPGMGRSVTIWGAQGTHPMGGTWTKVEHVLRVSAGTDGRLQVIDNGVTKVNYTGVTDNAGGTTRSVAVGGYARGRHVNNWRYFTDIYLDTSWARVILGNSSSFNTSTRREMQVPLSWSSTGITISTNLGAFADNSTAYLYVVDANGNVNAAGHPIVLGSSGTTPAPSAPTNLRIVG
jgi:hypothetical protein